MLPMNLDPHEPEKVAESVRLLKPALCRPHFRGSGMTWEDHGAGMVRPR